MENQKQTLQDILAIFDQLDQGIIEMSKTEVGDLMNSLNLKIDGYHEIHSRLEAEVLRLAEQKQLIEKKRKHAANALNRFEQGMIYKMKASGSKKLVGDYWNAVITPSKSIKPMRQPCEDDLAYMPSDILDVKFSWKKSEVAKYIGKDEAVDAVFEIEERDNLTFKPRKDVE